MLEIGVGVKFAESLMSARFTSSISDVLIKLMAINRDTVRYVANLARIELSDEELDHFTVQLDRILTYVDKLNTLDVSNLEPTSHALEMKNIYREDFVKKSLTAPEVIKNAPDKENNLFKVPKIRSFPESVAKI